MTAIPPEYDTVIVGSIEAAGIGGGGGFLHRWYLRIRIDEQLRGPPLPQPSIDLYLHSPAQEFPGLLTAGARDPNYTAPLLGTRWTWALQLRGTAIVAWVHRRAFGALTARPIRTQRAVLEPLLGDRAASLRRLARDTLQQLVAGFDPAAWYRAALTTRRDPIELAAILQGLGECGDAGDAETLAPFLRHAKNRVKAAANIATQRLARRHGG